MRGQLIHQLGVGRRVGDADVVDRIHDADAEKVSPDDVGDIAGEVRITRRREPLGHHATAVITRLEFRLLAAEELWLNVLLGQEVLRFAALAVVHDDFLRIVGGLAADLGEEGVETVVIVHRPAVKRMIMALGALDTHAHEDLGDVLGQLEAVELALVVVHRRDGDCTAISRKQFDDDLIDRAVLANLIGHPVVVE